MAISRRFETKNTTAVLGIEPCQGFLGAGFCKQYELSLCLNMNQRNQRVQGRGFLKDNQSANVQRAGAKRWAGSQFLYQSHCCGELTDSGLK